VRRRGERGREDTALHAGKEVVPLLILMTSHVDQVWSSRRAWIAPSIRFALGVDVRF
jgi:hypothetical protein